MATEPVEQQSIGVGDFFMLPDITALFGPQPCPDRSPDARAWLAAVEEAMNDEATWAPDQPSIAEKIAAWRRR
jgi:hypothetical protein